MRAPNGRCWADVLGECDGPITGEHLFTEALFGARVRLEGQRVPWLGGAPFETSIRRLKANVLCKSHNEELGRTADTAALRLLRALRQGARPMELPGSRILRPPVHRTIRAVDLGRWLCKTHCNFMVVAGFTPSRDLINYSFRRATERRIYFYFPMGLGDQLRLGDGRDPVVTYAQLLQDETPGYDGCQITLAGFPMIVSTARVLRNGLEMIDRLRGFNQNTPLGPYTIYFDWRGDE